MHRCLARIGFIVAACLATGGFAICVGARAECTGPASLEAQLRAHPDADAYVALGVWFDRHQQWECADRTIRSGLKIAPDSARLNYLLGLGLYSSGQAQEAIAPLRQAVHIDPDVLQPHLLLGAALARLGDNREALGEWQAALNIDPSSKEALDGLARSLIATGDYDTAIQALRSAPLDEKLTFDLATSYKQAGMYDEAAQALNQGLESFPDSDALTAALVALNVDESHFQAATLLAEKIARRKPNDLEARRIYLRTLVITGNNEVAAPLARSLLAVAPHDADLLNLNGLLEQKAGDFAAARKHLEEAVALSPNDYNPRVNLGVVLAELKDAAGARTQFEKAIELGTDEPQVHFELAKVLRTLGDMQAAQRQLALYQQKLKEKSDLAVAVSKATEAAEAVKSGDNSKAADLYRQACAAQPAECRPGLPAGHGPGQHGRREWRTHGAGAGGQGQSAFFSGAIPAWLHGFPGRRQRRGGAGVPRDRRGAAGQCGGLDFTGRHVGSRSAPGRGARRGSPGFAIAARQCGSARIEQETG